MVAGPLSQGEVLGEVLEGAIPPKHPYRTLGESDGTDTPGKITF
jgi:hypothetical protein